MTFSSEVWHEQTRKLSIDVRGGAVEAINDSFGAGTAVRTIENSKMGFAYSTKAGQLESELTEMARESAKKLEPDVYEFPSAEAGCCPSFFDASVFSGFSHEQKIEFALELEAGARGLDKRISGVRKASYVELSNEVKIKNSAGLDRSFSQGFCYLSITAIAKDEPDTEWAGEIEYYPEPSNIDPRSVGEAAAKKALSKLGAKSIPSQSAPSILDREAVSELLELLSQSYFADQIFKKKSALSGRLGEEIYSKRITIIDDATMKGAFGAAPFDGEGVDTRKNTVVENGVFKRVLCDNFWGRKLGFKSNGSAVRSSLTVPPKAGAHNIYIAAGENSPDALRKELYRGFYVTDLMGVHTANAITGEFSLGACGFWVENGKISHAVKGVTVAGNLHDLLRRTVAVGNDLKLWYGGGAPSLLVESLQIAGS